MKVFLHAGFIFTLIFGWSVNVYPCTKPAAPENMNNPKLSICAGMSTKIMASGIGTLGWYSEPTGGTYLGSGVNFITPILTETTIFYVQDSTCEASASRTAITVIVKPHAKADFSVNDVCEGDSASFVNLSQNAETYKWKFGDGGNSDKRSPKHFYKITGVPCFLNVTLVSINTNGCSDSTGKPMVVNAKPKSDFKFTTSGRQVTFTAAQPNNTLYQWRFGDGGSSTSANTQYHYLTFQSGKYKACLAVTNAAGCFSETCKEVYITGGIDKINKLSGVNIYPNPNKGNFTIAVEDPKADISITVYNLVGDVIKTIETSPLKSMYSLDLNVANGVYMVKVANGGLISSQKVTINK